MNHRDETSAFVEKLFEFIQPDFPIVVDGRDAQARAALLAENLPRNDVRVVLHRRDDHLIASLEVLSSITLGDEIDGLGCATDEHDFSWVGGIQEALNLGPGA